MRDRIAARFPRNLDVVLCDQRPSESRPQKIDPFVDRPGLDRGKNEVRNEFLSRIPHDAIHGPGRLGLFRKARKFLFLAHVGAVGHDLATVLFNQPAKDDRRVEPTAIREADPLNRAARGHGALLDSGKAAVYDKSPQTRAPDLRGAVPTSCAQESPSDCGDDSPPARRRERGLRRVPRR